MKKSNTPAVQANNQKSMMSFFTKKVQVQVTPDGEVGAPAVSQEVVDIVPGTQPEIFQTKPIAVTENGGSERSPSSPVTGDKDTSGQLVSRFFASTSKTPSHSQKSFVGTPLAPTNAAAPKAKAKAKAKPATTTTAASASSSASASASASSSAAAAAAAAAAPAAPAAPKEKSKKDKNAPKGALNAYLVFLKEGRSDTIALNPGLNSQDLTKAIAARWKAFTPEERAPFEEKAKLDKQRFTEEMAVYNKSKAGAQNDNDSETVTEAAATSATSATSAKSAKSATAPSSSSSAFSTASVPIPVSKVVAVAAQASAAAKVTEGIAFDAPMDVDVDVAVVADAAFASSNASTADAHTSSTKGQATNWLKCDACGKWRTQPEGTDMSIYPDTGPSNWTCAQNTWNPSMASCSAEEEDYSDESDDEAGNGEKQEDNEEGNSAVNRTLEEITTDGVIIHGKRKRKVPSNQIESVWKTWETADNKKPMYSVDDAGDGVDDADDEYEPNAEVQALLTGDKAAPKAKKAKKAPSLKSSVAGFLVSGCSDALFSGPIAVSAGALNEKASTKKEKAPPPPIEYPPEVALKISCNQEKLQLLADELMQCEAALQQENGYDLNADAMIAIEDLLTLVKTYVDPVTSPAKDATKKEATADGEVPIDEAAPVAAVASAPSSAVKAPKTATAPEGVSSADPVCATQGSAAPSSISTPLTPARAATPARVSTPAAPVVVANVSEVIATKIRCILARCIQNSVGTLSIVSSEVEETLQYTLGALLELAPSLKVVKAVEAKSEVSSSSGEVIVIDCEDAVVVSSDSSAAMDTEAVEVPVSVATSSLLSSAEALAESEAAPGNEADCEKQKPMEDNDDVAIAADAEVAAAAPLLVLSERQLEVATFAVNGLRNLLQPVVLSEVIKGLAERKSYGVRSRDSLLFESTETVAAFRWEVHSSQYFTDASQKFNVTLKGVRNKYSGVMKGVGKIIEQLSKQPLDEAKVLKEEEATAKKTADLEKFKEKRREQEEKSKAKRLSDSEKKHRDDEAKEVKRREKEEADTKKKAEKEEKRLEKEREKAEKVPTEREIKKALEAEKLARQKSMMMGFLKAAPAAPVSASKAGNSSVAKVSGPDTTVIMARVIESVVDNGVIDVDETDEEMKERKLRAFERAVNSNMSIENILKSHRERYTKLQTLPNFKRQPRRKPTAITVTTSAAAEPGQQPRSAFDTVADNENYAELRDVKVDSKIRTFFFCEDYRPAYVGTFSKRSVIVSGRRPLEKDTNVVDYDVDSEGEWDEDEADGEDILGSDGEDEDGEENELEYDDMFRRDNDFGSDYESDEDGLAAVSKTTSGKVDRVELVGPRFVQGGMGYMIRNGKAREYSSAVVTPNGAPSSSSSKSVSVGASSYYRQDDGVESADSPELLAQNPVLVFVGVGQAAEATRLMDYAAVCYNSPLFSEEKQLLDESNRKKQLLTSKTTTKATKDNKGGSASKSKGKQRSGSGLGDTTTATPTIGDPVTAAAGAGAGAGASDGGSTTPSAPSAKKKGTSTVAHFDNDDTTRALVTLAHGSKEGVDKIVMQFHTEHPAIPKLQIEKKLKDFATKSRHAEGHGSARWVVKDAELLRLGLAETVGTTPLQYSPAKKAVKKRITPVSDKGAPAANQPTVLQGIEKMPEDGAGPKSLGVPATKEKPGIKSAFAAVSASTSSTDAVNVLPSSSIKRKRQTKDSPASDSGSASANAAASPSVSVGASAGSELPTAKKSKVVLAAMTGDKEATKIMSFASMLPILKAVLPAEAVDASVGGDATEAMNID